MSPLISEQARSRNILRCRLNKTVAAVVLLALGTPSLPSVAAGASPAEPARAAASAQVEVQREAYLMGTLCAATGTHDDRPQGLAALEDAFAAIRRSEALLSTWRDDTPLARLAGAEPGRAVAVPAELARLLADVRGIWQQTGGAFDPAIGALIAAWDVRGEGRTPGAKELAEARARSGMSRVQVDVAARTVTLQAPGLGFDAGAFGKGEGLARAAEALRKAGLRDWWLDFGGQVLVAADGPEREIPVAHPADRDRPAAWLRLRGLSAATSSGSERPGHILDPRSGRPAAEFGSVTVIGRDPMRVDALATALFVLGPAEGMALALAMPDIEALFIVKGGSGWRMSATPGAAARLTRSELPLEAVAPAAHEPINGPGARPARPGQADRGLPFITPGAASASEAPPAQELHS